LPARHRLGVVLLVPPPFDREVDALRRACGDGTVDRVPPHLTLVPPVNVRADHLDAALGVLRRAGAATRPFGLVLGPVQSFLPVNPVLYLDVGGDVAAVVALRERVFVEPLTRTLSWPFVPHVTVVDDGVPERLDASVTALADVRLEITFERIHLLEESRQPDGGRVWRPMADAALAAPAVVARGGLELELAVTERPGPEVDAWLGRTWEAHGRSEYGDDWATDDPVVVTGRRQGEVVGVAEGHTRRTEAYLAGLVVAPEVRGEGVGSHLLAAFADECRQRGCAVLNLRSVAGGPAEAFYRDRGFTTVVALPRWRHGRDFVQLRRLLGATLPP